MNLTPQLVLGGLLSEAWVRSIQSYSRSLEYYHIRVRNGIQPSTPLYDLFNVERQNVFLTVGNLLYIAITLCLFVFMKKRKSGFRLRWVLVVYDAANVLLASYVALSIIQYKYKYGGLLLCNSIANDLEGVKLSQVFVLFYLQKYFEFFDTWFFILRKSTRQVTFLHLFHHSSITVVVGSILPFDYNGDMYLPIFLNSANHTMIYLHYLLATLGIKSFWAPYITSMQFLQFIVIFAQSLLAYRVGPTCGSPDFAKVLMIVYMGSMITLFGNFFLQKYIFRTPSSSLDMCGVIKRPLNTYSNIPAQYCGIAVLDSAGTCTIILPDDFPDEEKMSRETLRYNPFCVVYSLTAIAVAMPSLHISREVGREKLEAKMSPNKRKKRSKEMHFDGSSGSASVPTADKKGVNPLSMNAKSSSDPHLQSTELDLSKKMTKSASFSDFSLVGSVEHNDRLIDGPLPLQDSFNQIRSGISDVFRRSRSSGEFSKLSTSICSALNELDRTDSSAADDQSGRGERISAASMSGVSISSQALPLSFQISGGISGGKVSWILHTVPRSRNVTYGSSEGIKSFVGVGISMPVGISTAGATGEFRDFKKIDDDEEGKKNALNQQQDWRAIS